MPLATLLAPAPTAGRRVLQLESRAGTTGWAPLQRRSSPYLSRCGPFVESFSHRVHELNFSLVFHSEVPESFTAYLGDI
jgi:hypothetical protein